MSEVYAEDIPLPAHDVARKDLTSFTQLSADEIAAPSKFRQYIEVLVSSGESISEKIAKCALGMIREYNQIARSVARVSPRLAP